MLDYLSKSPPADWGMLLVAAISLCIAIRTLLYARKQYEQSKQAQEELNYPYVIFDIRQVKGGIVEVYLKNLGSTVAYDISIESNPPFESASDDAFWLFDELPALVPGQEWATIWETQIAERRDSDLPDRMEVTVRYKDSSEKPHTTPTVIDLKAYWGRTFLVDNDLSKVASELKKQTDALKKTESHLKSMRKSIGPDVDGQRNIIESLREIAEPMGSGKLPFLTQIFTRQKR